MRVCVRVGVRVCVWRVCSVCVCVRSSCLLLLRPRPRPLAREAVNNATLNVTASHAARAVPPPSPHPPPLLPTSHTLLTYPLPLM